jgi:hypothetical protein
MILEINKKKYSELVTDYNNKYNTLVNQLRQTTVPDYMITHLAKSFLLKETYELNVLNEMIQTQKDYIAYKSRGRKKTDGHS